MRDKLIELLAEKCMATCKERKCHVCSEKHCKQHREECCGFYADHLLANGVIVLPVKVGDTVWIKGDRFPAEIKQIIIHEEGISFDYVEVEHNYEDDEVWNDGSFDIEDIGKTVFFTREAAEAAVRKEYEGK